MGTRLLEVRLAADVGQRELARAAGVTHSLVRSIEKATKATRHSTLELLVTTLGLFTDVEGLLEELVGLADGTIAPESSYPGAAEKVAARRAAVAAPQRAQLDRALRRAREAGDNRALRQLAATPLHDLATLLALLGIEPDDADHVRFPGASGDRPADG